MSAQTVIRNFMSSLDATTKSGTAALDNAVASSSNFKSWAELINTMANDCAAYDGNGDSFLYEKCGIILNNGDTGAITGSDAGGGSTKTADSIVPESGDWQYPSSSSFNIGGLTVNINDFENLDTSEQWIVGALYTWWIKESLSLIDSSFGINFNESGTTVKTLNISFYNSTDGKMAISHYSSGQKSTDLQLRINMHYYENIDTTNPNGVGSSEALNTLDRTIAHELVHAVMSANVDYYGNLPVSFKEGSAELVHGIDDKRYSQIVSLSNDAVALKNAMSGTGTISYTAGYIALRYLAKQATEGRDPSTDVSNKISTVTPAQIEDTVTSSATYTLPSAQAIDTTNGGSTFDGVTLKLYGQIAEDILTEVVNPFTSSTSYSYASSAIVIDASAMTTAHFIGGNSNNNHIIAGDAGSTIWGGAGGDDILQGGKGIDNFWYAQGNGNDAALNFQTSAGGDILSFMGGGVASFYREQNVIAVVMGDGGTFTAVLDDATGDAIIKISSDGVNTLKAKIGNSSITNDFTYQGDDVLYVGGNNVDALHVLNPGAIVNLGKGFCSNVEVLDASWSGGANILFGDATNNAIISGGNSSTLWGGVGDDIIYGGDGTDYFLFGAGDGNDVLFNVNDDDSIILYNATLKDVTFAQETDSGFVIGVGSNVLTVVGNSNAVSFADGSTFRYNRVAKTWTTA